MAYKDEQLIEEKVFKDPVHRYIHVRDRAVWDLIATPEFQRLRRIKQLGTTNLTFHGAEHSRFNHSLGVYEIVRRITNNFADRERWNREQRLLCLCAALLHDLGHYHSRIHLRKYSSWIMSSLHKKLSWEIRR